ncbi:MAG: 3-dehydroquinate synthase [Paramuribaculum sp.]|nr:3-dehydroquinate synthase [Paramuribaculum sp.]
MSQQLIFTNDVAGAIDNWARTAAPTRLFVIADTNTASLVLPQLEEKSSAIAEAAKIIVGAGEGFKNITTLAEIWSELCSGGATRSAAVINIGGGVITDMGGFAAATFKRGIRFVNVPTTLLAAVDAAVGGKTGIDFRGLKNEIGAFAPADAVIISTRFFRTLPATELRSGYAEMLKHALLAGDGSFDRLISVEPDSLTDDELLELVKQSVLVKKDVVTKDPTEKGLRKALNLGHTPGHAFESLALEKGSPVPHGYAVAWGLVVDLVLSHLKLGFPSALLRQVAQYVLDTYNVPDINCTDYPRIVEYMRHDKKNAGDGTISFTLLSAPGQVDVSCTAEPDEITAALDIFRDLMHI